MMASFALGMLIYLHQLWFLTVSKVVPDPHLVGTSLVGDKSYINSDLTDMLVGRGLPYPSSSGILLRQVGYMGP
jgi:hypothetical protein